MSEAQIRRMKGGARGEMSMDKGAEGQQRELLVRSAEGWNSREKRERKRKGTMEYAYRGGGRN